MKKPSRTAVAVGAGAVGLGLGGTAGWGITHGAHSRMRRIEEANEQRKREIENEYLRKLRDEKAASRALKKEWAYLEAKQELTQFGVIKNAKDKLSKVISEKSDEWIGKLAGVATKKLPPELVGSVIKNQPQIQRSIRHGLTEVGKTARIAIPAAIGGGALVGGAAMATKESRERAKILKHQREKMERREKMTRERMKEMNRSNTNLTGRIRTTDFFVPQPVKKVFGNVTQRVSNGVGALTGRGVRQGHKVMQNAQGIADDQMLQPGRVAKLNSQITAHQQPGSANSRAAADQVNQQIGADRSMGKAQYRQRLSDQRLNQQTQNPQGAAPTPPPAPGPAAVKQRAATNQQDAEAFRNDPNMTAERQAKAAEVKQQGQQMVDQGYGDMKNAWKNVGIYGGGGAALVGGGMLAGHAMGGGGQQPRQPQQPYDPFARRYMSARVPTTNFAIVGPPRKLPRPPKGGSVWGAPKPMQVPQKWMRTPPITPPAAKFKNQNMRRNNMSAQVPTTDFWTPRRVIGYGKRVVNQAAAAMSPKLGGNSIERVGRGVRAGNVEVANIKRERSRARQAYENTPRGQGVGKARENRQAVLGRFDKMPTRNTVANPRPQRQAPAAAPAPAPMLSGGPSAVRSRGGLKDSAQAYEARRAMRRQRQPQPQAQMMSARVRTTNFNSPQVRAQMVADAMRRAKAPAKKLRMGRPQHGGITDELGDGQRWKQSTNSRRRGGMSFSNEEVLINLSAEREQKFLAKLNVVLDAEMTQFSNDVSDTDFSRPRNTSGQFASVNGMGAANPQAMAAAYGPGQMQVQSPDASQMGGSVPPLRQPFDGAGQRDASATPFMG